ncbi:hypothetical protein BJ138DRAFT_905864 [Hygrophoropsis aurantiaca]|uniref:Uncharacterized protein n=1 Tax=Hygrophoropsis aurantiaca TaxID=72124 RepID=A0ACB8AF92_9AGAM|nr:hypothetical protein BJ138DRAFT_905864 [Hygrophoropsis aurantiaca]
MQQQRIQPHLQPTCHSFIELSPMTFDVTTLSRGDVIFAIPPPINDAAVPITKTKGGKIGKHPIIVFAVDAPAKTVQGAMVQSFNNATTLDESGLKPEQYFWFLPVTPAVKESIHNPVSARPGTAGKHEWINLKDVLTITEDKVKKQLDGKISPTALTEIENAIKKAHAHVK